ncbi:DegT/DnrJ/EryC1/StrS family aminotransferase [Salinibacter altiplanensis]|uniref:DegT/DnrJ/EryC1/StrS family aminotransferase n=1 Tax=Salinibacter altiplanensis TaxID=1803181 RepID=UPI000C9F08CF|nr:DegT/DnrJ/EryC1/StrS family aminotransferase [Salinibacter altiplanensis]
MQDRLQQRLGEFFGANYLFPVGSGTVGLTHVLEASNVEDMHVLIPAFTCPNVAVSVWAAGGIPKVVDVSPTSLCLTPETVDGALGDDVAAIVAVDAFGCPAPVEELSDLANNSKCTVIDDACQAYGGVSEGRKVGVRGDVGVVSFGYSKPVSVNAGGLLMTNSASMAGRLKQTVDSFSSSWGAGLRNSLALHLIKRDSPRWHYRIGIMLGLFNYAFPPGKLDVLEDRWDTFQNNLPQTKRSLGELRRLLSRLQCVDRVIPQSEQDWLPWRMSLYVDTPAHRDRLRESFAELGVGTSTLYRPITDFSWTLKQHSYLSTAHDLYRHVLNVHHGSTDQAVRETIKALRPVCGSRSPQNSI